MPLAVDRTRFEVWELWYKDGDDEYLEKVGAHWERLKGVVQEDVDIYQEWAAASRSTAYTRNIFNNRECKITHFHQVVQDMLDAETETGSPWLPRITSQESTSTRRCARTPSTSWRA